MFGNVQPNFAIETTPLFKKAVKWWDLHCPCAYTRKQHIANPGINLPNQEGKELGIEIAKILKEMDG